MYCRCYCYIVSFLETMAEFPRFDMSGIFHPKNISFEYQACATRNQIQRCEHNGCNSDKLKKKLKVLEWLIEHGEDIPNTAPSRRLINVVDSTGIYFEQVPVEFCYWGGFANKVGWKPLFRNAVSGVFVEQSPGHYVYIEHARDTLNGQYNTTARSRAEYRYRNTGVNSGCNPHN